MKKTLSLILALIMVFTFIAPAVTAIPVMAEDTTDETTYQAEIMKVKDGKNAIVTFTIDDGVYENDLLIESLFREYGLKAATLMLVPKRVMGQDGSGRTTVSQAWDLMKDGYVEVQGHSYSHLYLAPEGHPDHNADNLTDENRYREIVECLSFMKSNFPDVDQVAFAVPGGTYDDAATELVMQTYYASRRSTGVTSGSWQSLTPANTAEKGGWYFLETFWMYDNNVDEALAYLDLCIEKGGWFLAGTHNVIPSGLNDISEENLRTILAAVKAKQDAGLVWATNYSTAVKYLREYENSTVRQYSNAFGLYVDLTMSATTEAGLALPSSVFDEPLTVKVEIPEGWANVRFSQKGLHTTAKSFKEGDKTYAYVDIVPNSGSVLISNADVSLEKQSTTSTLAMVKGGASAIATMTFDDGHPRTAEKLNELLAKYDGKASLMIYPRKSFNNSTNIQYWNQIASEGYLNIESHSYTHDYITSGYPENHYEEKYIYETKGAQDFIRESVPGQDVLSMTVPYASYINDAYKHVISTYYSALANSCVLVSYPGRMQSLDPTFADPATGNHPGGSWHDVYYVRLQPIYSDSVYPQLTMENIIGYLDKCVAEGGWFISSCHGIYQGENQDLTEEQLIQLLEAMNVYQKQNKLWVTSFSDATKYIRERQNSTVTSYTYGDGIYYVDLTMADTTADGLSLTETVTDADGTVRKLFNMPLTVKVEVPKAWSEIVYSQAGGERMYAETFTELGRTYAYIDLVPNGGTAIFESTTGESLDSEAPERPVGYYEAPQGSYVPTNPDVVYAVFASENDFKSGKAPVAEYTESKLTQEAVDAGVYIHLYKDVADSVKFVLSKTLVINLAGHALTSPAGLAEVKTGGSLTVKNGFNYNKQQIHSRNGSTLIFDNVHFINTYTTFGWGLGADLILFRNCKLDMNSQGSYFFMSGNTPSKTKSEMKFINTDLNINAGVSADYGLFRITESDYYTTKWIITFDKDSLITGNINNWATTIESNILQTGTTDTYQRFSFTQQILFEEGVTFSEGAKPDFTYKQIKLNDDNSTTTTTYKVPADDATLKMAVVYPGTTYQLLGKVEFTEEGDYYIATVPGGRPDVPVGTYLPVEGVWTPDDPTVTYALWSTENAFLTGKEPLKTFTSTTLEIADFESGGYLHVYRNITAPEVVFPKNSTVINLAGHTLTASKGLEYRGVGQFTLKNGTVTTSAQANFRNSCTVLFENIHYYNGNAAFGYGSNYYRWTIKDSIIELNNASSYLFLGGNPPTGAMETLFINTDIKVNGGTHATNGLLKFTATTNSAVAPMVFFDKDSSLTGNIGIFATVTETDANVFGVPCEIRMEEGFTVSANVYSQIFKYTGALREGSEGSYTVSAPTLRDMNDGKLNSTVLLPGETSATTYAYSFVKSGDLYVLDIANPDDTPDEPTDWTPKSDTTHAVWASKEDYESGKAPIAEFSGALTVANVTSGGATSYVRLFKASVSVREQLLITNGVTVVIDLADNTLINPVGIEIMGGTSLTIENGTYNHTGGQVYFAPISYMTYRNLDITVSYANTLTYGYGATEILYENCKVTLTRENNYFHLGSQPEPKTATLKVVNTEFIINADLSSHLFTVYESSWGYSAGWTVIFDKDSSITGTGSIPGLVKLTEGFRFVSGGTSLHEKFINTQTFTFEAGFSMDDKFKVDVDKYYFVGLDFDASVSAGSAVFKAPVLLPADDSVCKITFGSEVTPPEPDVWTPASGTTYAVWASKDDYLAGKAPIGEYTGALTVANLTSAGATNYVRVYASAIETAECIWPKNGSTVHIDLGGNTLTNAYGVEITDGATFILENGTYNHTNLQAYYRDKSYTTYRNLTINVTTYANLTYGGGFTELTYENCTVYLNHVNNYFRLSAISGGTRYALNIINTDFVVNVALGQPFFYFIESSYSADCNYEINIDGDSSITGKGSMPGFAVLYENYLYLDGKDYYETFVKTQNINIADGFEISKNLLTGFGTYQFYELDREASKTEGKAVYKTPVSLPANDALFTVTLGKTPINDGKLFVSPNKDASAYTVSYEMDKVNTGWYRFDSTVGAWVGTLAVKGNSGLAQFTPADYKSFNKGENVIFAQDIEVNTEIISSNVNNTDYVLDLGGNRLVLNTTFALSLYSGGAYQYMSITFKNGTIVGNFNQPFYGFGHKDGVFTFDGITFEFGDRTRTFGSVYTGTWKIINCTVNAKSGTFLGFEKADHYKAIMVENSTINATTAFYVPLSASNQLDSDSFYVKNSVINASGTLLNVPNVSSTASSYETLSVFGSEINTPAIFRSDAMAGTVTVILSDTKLASKPAIYVANALTENTSTAKVVFAEGEMLMAITGISGFNYKVGKSPLASGDLQANLTLYTDFQLNLFANPDVVDSILVNGEKVDFTVFEGKNKYVIRNIRPDTAADTVTLTVTVTVNGVTYTYDIAYSVLAYAKAVVKSESVSDDAKALVSAAMAYVKAAYAYAGKDAPAFEGVAFDSFTADAGVATMPAAIKGAQLDLDSGFKLRFNIAEGYNGTIVVNGTSYEVVNGAYNGITYFEVNMRAYALCNTPVVITADGVTGEYSLANYVAFANASGNAKLATLANALYDYAAYANAYKAAN